MPLADPITEVDTVSSLPELYTPGRLVCYGTGTSAKYAEFNEGVITNIFMGEIQPQKQVVPNTTLLDPYFITILDSALWNGLFDDENSFLESISFYTWVDLANFDSEQDDQPPTVAVPILGLTEIITSDCEIRVSTRDSDTGDQMSVFNQGDGEIVMIDFQLPGTGPYPGGIFHGYKITITTTFVRIDEITNESVNESQIIRFGDLMDPPIQDEATGGGELEEGQFTVLRGIKGVFSNIDPDAVYIDPNGEENNEGEDYEDPEGAIPQPEDVIVRTVIAIGIAEREE